MALAAGTRFGPYQVAESIGAGGMGEVYRATDTNLKREVALKILPQAFAEDADRVARFQREAEALAALNHSNIAQVYGLERADGSTAIVMELVEGPTLADRIAQGPIPYDEALGIAMQVAEALEAAHGRSIIHRDLKPANIKVRPDGTVKVLDFGIATAPESPLATSGRRSPTLLTPALTEAGILLGTAAYMSPEQARGKPVDERADIWAFGCLLYEMLTGQPTFGGEDVTTTLARVLEREAKLDALPGALPLAARRTIELCLQKNPAKRIADIRDVRLALEGVFTVESAWPAKAAALARPAWRRALPFAATAVVVVIVTALTVWVAMRPEHEPVNRFAVPLDQPLRNTGRPVMALSPDGRHFVYNATGGFYFRAMGELEPRLMPGTEEASTSPFFSPDGQAIAYFTFAGSQLRRIAISGGASVVVAAGLSNPYGTSWQADGTILFAQPEGIFRVSDSGGTPELVVMARDGEQFHGAELLPDGDSVLFSVMPTGLSWDSAQIVVESLSSGERTVLVGGGSDPRYLPTGHIVYGLGDGLFAVAFDAQSLTVSGGAVPLVQGVMRPSAGQTGAANYAVSQDGTLAYVTGLARTPQRTLVWVDRDGREEPINVPPRNYMYAQLSPDGMRVALDSRDQENDIWIFDLERETLQRLTFDPGLNRSPIWSPDGQRVAFSRALEGTEELYWQAADGSGTPAPLTEGSGVELMPNDFTPDGATLLYMPVLSPRDIWIVDVDGPERDGTQLLATPANEHAAVVSPDGRWIAYQSDESGQYEVYVRPFPDVDSGRWQISKAGGARPLWSHDGQELYYHAAGRGSAVSVMGVSVESGSSFRPGTPETLIEGPYALPNDGQHVYDVSADGQRFLMIKNLEVDNEETQTQIVVVQNFFEELERLVPSN